MLDNARYGKQNETRDLNNHTTEKEDQRYIESLMVLPSHHHDNIQTNQSQASSLCQSKQSDQTQVARQFVPRNNTEPVKNCTKLDKQLLDEIVKKVATELLSRTTLEEATLDNKADSDRVTNTNWNKGGRCMCYESWFSVLGYPRNNLISPNNTTFFSCVRIYGAK